MNTKKKVLGQFFTNPLIADFMSKLVYFDGAKTALDPAVGEGVFLKHLDINKNSELNYIAYDVDEDMIETSKRIFNNNVQYHCKDYLLSEISNKPDIIICNPPYNKFQEIPKRDEYIELFAKKYGISISGYSNLCVYFLVKSLDKVKPNGIAAFIISKSTMDKRNPTARKLMAQRGELIGAIRLPNTAFKENAGTEVTSDILFFRKHERMMELEPDWIHVSQNETGMVMNSYFMEHPELYSAEWK